MKRLLFILSFLFWLMMMGLLLRDHLRENRLEGEGAILNVVRSAPSATSWFGIYRAGRKIGCCEMTIAADALGDAVAYRIDLYIKLTLPHAVSALGEVTLRDPGGLNSFSFQVRSGTQMFFMNGSREGSDLLIDCDFGGFNLPPGSFLHDLRSAQGGSLRLSLGHLRDSAVSVSAGAEEVIKIRGVMTAARRHTVSSAHREVSFWLDGSGGVLLVEFPGELNIVREPQALAASLE